ncbi:MAG: DNA polymerase III subunit delta [Muribaculaceae bacterium]|nr:DNA polymerase III subunit delta [Muribaculaceae bacterium]
MATEVATFAGLKNQLASRKYAPVYLLHGEQPYFTDELVKLFENILPPADRDFNQYILYAPEVEPAIVVNKCRSYPMMSDYQVVIVKEAQVPGANYLNAFAAYAENPNPSTILVIVGRGKTVSCAELTKAIRKGGGVIYESKRIYENQIGPAIMQVVKDMQLNIEPKALSMLQDYVGTDLARIHNEVSKLAEILGPNAMITPESIERNIGISKDFNTNEYIAAIASRNATKAFQIVEYFNRNNKSGPPQVVSTALFNLFSNMLVGVYAPDKSDAALLKLFNFKFAIQLTDIKRGLSNYNAWQMIACINAIREFDAMSKGVGSRQNPYDLMHDLTFKILTTNGKIEI